MVSSELPAMSSSPEWRPDPTHHLLLTAGPPSLELDLPAFLAHHPPAIRLFLKSRTVGPFSQGHMAMCFLQPLEKDPNFWPQPGPSSTWLGPALMGFISLQSSAVFP